MRRLLIIIIPLLLSTFFLFTFFIYDGEMIGDGGKHEQSTVTWYDVVKFVGEFRNGKWRRTLSMNLHFWNSMPLDNEISHTYNPLHTHFFKPY